MQIFLETEVIIIIEKRSHVLLDTKKKSVFNYYELKELIQALNLAWTQLEEPAPTEKTED